MRETYLRQGRQTVNLGLVNVVHELFPDEQLKTSYSILEAVFYSLVDSALSTREVAQIEARLRQWVAADQPIEDLGRKDGYHTYQLGDQVIRAVYPANARSSDVEAFAVVPFGQGFIVDFDEAQNGTKVPLILPVQLSALYAEGQRWLDLIDIEVVADVNRYVRERRYPKLIGIAEALHEKKVSQIADSIIQQSRALRVLLVSGPSSSGKTTFAQRLSTQLEVNGRRPVSLTLDNYFVDRADTPLDADGRYDFDTIHALDLPLLRRHFSQLVAGEAVEVPTFDFVSGTRTAQSTPLQVGPSEILIVEGIHALNPELLGGIDRRQVYKVYVSALGGLNIDLMNRVPTTEIRILRRLVRDRKFRGTEPAETLDQWASVRRGEFRSVFRFQEDADVMFNSSLLFELNALRPFAEEALGHIPDDSPHVGTRDRLLGLLSFFEPMDPAKVPFNSILREFIGGSLYHD